MNLIKINVKTAGEGCNLLPKAKGLKEFFEDEFIKQNDENAELHLDNYARLIKNNGLSNTRGRKPVQRVLNSEVGENTEMMQPLMNIDNDIYPVTSATRIEKREVEVKSKPRPMLQRIHSKKNKANKNLKFIACKTIISEHNGYVIKKFIHYDTWCVIKPIISPIENATQSQRLDFPLVKLANASSYMTLPSERWNTKVVLHKVSPTVLRRHTLTIYSGDLKSHNIAERDRKKYQPTCVVFRRTAREELGDQERNEIHVAFDRVVICTNKYIKISFDGKYVQLNGAPDSVTCLADMQKLLDIIHCISLANPMVEVMERQIYEAE